MFRRSVSRLGYAHIKMSYLHDQTTDYQRALKVLNGLQSNASTLKEASKHVQNGNLKPQEKKLELTIKYLERCCIKVQDLEEKVIHVAGTKGKGSTCALTESILRKHGFKTGFFSSPHLVSVTERIRIDGKPISAVKFASYFWNFYNRLNKWKEDEDDMPSYFKFLTVMAFGIFIEEKVDVAIIEVGIGGEYDCTNVFRKTAVVGITSLGLDHVNILGDTVESIAWQKAGIIKPGAYKVFTASNQHPSALRMLQRRAQEKKCSLMVAPSIAAYNWVCMEHKSAIEDLLVRIPVFSINCSLAIQLAHAWINFLSNKNGRLMEELSPMTVPEATSKGIAICKWAGRFHKLESCNSITFYLDGAHTHNSMLVCAGWFDILCPLRSGVKRILVFNSTGKRDIGSLLSPLIGCQFTSIYFCSNNLNDDPSNSPLDLIHLRVSAGDAMERCQEHCAIWSELGGKGELQVVGSVHSVIQAIMNVGGPAEVLVTGSLHLVGSVLAVIDPQLNTATSLFDNFTSI